MEKEKNKRPGPDTTVIIPNLNGMRYLKDCLDSLLACEERPFPVIVVDNGSTDASRDFVRREYPSVDLFCFPENRGFSAAVNAGIQKAQTAYVILLNNDTVVEKHFVSRLTKAVSEKENYFSAGARMVTMSDPQVIDDAGDYYCVLGWAFARGKGKARERYERPCNVFAACGGAAIYRTKALRELGLFDEAFFAYLEDIDIGYRAKLQGYVNRFEPGAVVRHAGSGSSGSRYNAFKVRLSSRNSVYLPLKHMPLPQLLLNLPFLLAGYILKYLFFLKKGYGCLYLEGLRKGLRMGLQERKRKKASVVSVGRKALPVYLRIEGELLYNLLLRLFFC